MILRLANHGKNKAKLAICTSLVFCCFLIGCGLEIRRRADTVEQIVSDAQSACIQGQNDRADKLFAEAVSLAETIEGDQLPVIEALNRYAAFKKQHGQLGASKELFRRAITVSESVVKLGEAPDVPTNEDQKKLFFQAKKSYVGLAECFSDEGAFRVAEQLFGKAIKIEELLSVAHATKDSPSASALYQAMVNREGNELNALDSYDKSQKAKSPQLGNRRTSRTRFGDLINEALEEPQVDRRESKLLKIVSDALKRYGPREFEYRVAFSKLARHYIDAGQFGKAVALIEVDLLRYPISTEKLELADLSSLENAECVIDDISMMMHPLIMLKRNDEAIKQGQRVLAIAGNLKSKNSVPFETVVADLGHAYAAKNQYSEASRFGQRLVDMIPVGSDTAERRANCYQELADYYLCLCDFIKAKAAAEKGLAVVSKENVKSPVQLHLLFTLGRILDALKENERAQSCFSRCIALCRASGDFDLESSITERIAEMQKVKGDFKGAIKTLADFEKVIASGQHPRKRELEANVIKRRAYVLEAEGKHREAIELMTRLVEMGTKYDASKINTAGRMNELASVCIRGGRLDLAESWGRKAVVMCEKVPESNGRDGPLASTLLQLSYCLTHRKKYEDQRRVVSRVLSICLSGKKDVPVQYTLLSYVRLAAAEIKVGKISQAKEHNEKALAIISSGEMNGSEEIGNAMGEAADNCYFLGDLEGAAKLYKRLFAEYPGAGKDTLGLERMKRYGDALKRLNRNEEAPPSVTIDARRRSCISASCHAVIASRPCKHGAGC